jgi:hypothetical protein
MTSYLYVAPLNTSQRGYADTGEDQLRPVDLATVIRQVSAFLKAWNWSLWPTRLPWSLTSLLLHQRAIQYAFRYLTIYEFLSRSTAAAGNYAFALIRTSGVTSPRRPEAFFPLMSKPLAFIVLLATHQGH